MAPQHDDNNTILRNLHLIATPWNLFIFLINPASAWAWMMYLCLHMRQIPLPPRLTFWLGFAGPIAAMALEFITSEMIKDRLPREGYTQKRTRSRELDLLVTFAMCCAFLYHVLRWDEEMEDGGWDGWSIGILVVWSGVGFVSVVFLMSMGPILWFTVRTG